MQYKIGDKVEIIRRSNGGTAYAHLFTKGDICEVIAGPDVDGDYILKDHTGLNQFVNPRDFKPAFESIGGGVDELRERHGRLPTNSEGHEGGTTFDMNQNSI